ncbi:MAG: sensitivity to high expression protein she9 [Watsoniomyces obsoletus]|nr:MAG: sensitivity to high expression protein she9 [Watsoniomyces obsoletus]
MASGTARYLRYILFAFFALAVLYFISSSSIARRPLSETGHMLSEQAGHLKSSLDHKTAVVGAPQAQNTPAANAPVAAAPAAAPRPVDAGPKQNATFVTLARNSDVWEIARSIRQVEDRFNHRYHYDWVFLNDKPFDSQFKKVTTALASGKTRYGEIPRAHWSFPEFIDQERAKKTREEMAAKKVIYGDSVSYRHMCRFESGFFFRQPLMQEYEWYWRVEPGIELFCDITYDAFKFMADNKKKYSFVISLYEYLETIPTLWDSVKKFINAHPEHIAKNNGMEFISDDGGDTYNKCHFWSNFEIGNLNWLRSQAYLDYFEHLDREGGFFYERWGDAPVHSIAASLLLDKSEIHFFNDIAYYHVPFTHCPTSDKVRTQNKCHCNPKDNFDWKGYSCTARFFDINGLEKPDGYENQMD